MCNGCLKELRIRFRNQFPQLVTDEDLNGGDAVDYLSELYEFAGTELKSRGVDMTTDKQAEQELLDQAGEDE